MDGVLFLHPGITISSLSLVFPFSSSSSLSLLARKLGMASLFRPRRPEDPPASQSGGATWLTGLVSGAGRLISSVFHPDASSYSSSFSDEDEDNLVPSRELDAVNQSGKQLEVVKDCTDGSLAIVSKVEAKHAIEQLLMQETFSRDEYTKLTNILQSRVVDFRTAEVGEDGVQKEFPRWTSGHVSAFRGGCPSLNQVTKQPELISYSPCSLNDLSPGSSICQLHTPKLHSMAVMEAKKWLDEKKLASSSKSDLGCGPCTLNTDMLHYDSEGKISSPVDVAKSYMQSLLSWQSPSLSSNGFETAQPSGMHLCRDETPKATTDNSLPSLQVLKRNALSLGSQEALDETRRVRLKSIDHIPEFLTFKQFDLSSRSLENEACKAFSEAVRKGQEVFGTFRDSNSLQAASSLDGSARLYSELPVEDHRLDGALTAHDAKAAGANDPLKIGNATCTNIISDAEEVIANQSTLENSGLEPTTIVDNDKSPDPATKSDENQDVEEPSQTKKSVGRVPVSSDSFVVALTTVEHAGKRSRKGRGQVQKETNASPNKIAMNSSSRSKANPLVGTEEGRHQTVSCKVEPAAGVSKRTSETTTVRGPRTSKVTSRSQNGMTMKSVKEVLTKPEPSTSRPRGGRAVVRTRRGR